MRTELMKQKNFVNNGKLRCRKSNNMNFIISIILIHSILSFFFKPTNKLFCGIFGFLGANPKAFDITKFNVLGMFNDSRGKDSCGIYKNNAVYYGVDKEKLFQDAVQNKIFPVEINRMNVVLGHCRKASVGAVGITTAQPVTVTDDQGKIVFVMIHNGTLLNYKELAAKYGVDYDDAQTDSQIFCNVVYKVGYEVLGEYEGAGAFVFYDVENDLTRIFKGASKTAEYSKEVTEERPLCFFKEKGRDVIWFSSMMNSLEFIKTFKEPETVYTFTANTLYTIQNGVIIDRVLIDRSERYQTKTYSAKDYSGYNNYGKGRSGNFTYYGNIGIEEQAAKPEYILYNKGRYYLNGKLAEGVISCDFEGQTNAANPSYKVAFVRGIMLSSYRLYDSAKTLDNDIDLLPLAEDSCPIYISESEQYMKYDPKRLTEKAVTSGKFEPIFSLFKYTILSNNCGVLKEEQTSKKNIVWGSDFGKEARE